MAKILQKLFELLSKKSFRIILSIIIFLLLLTIAIKKTYIDPKKFKETIDILSSKDEKSFEFIVSENKKLDLLKEMEKKNATNNNIPTITIKKKEIVIDKYEKEESIQKATNLFTILIRLNEVYKERLKNKKINYNKKAKDGDYVYFSIKTDESIKLEEKLKEQGRKNIMEDIKMFLFVDKNDDIHYEKILNKKVGDTIVITMDDMLKGLDDKELQEVKKILNTKLKKVDKNANITDSTILQESRQYLTILDFIPKNIVKELDLQQFNTNN